jgi:hypothetical protein
MQSDAFFKHTSVWIALQYRVVPTIAGSVLNFGDDESTDNPAYSIVQRVAGDQFERLFQPFS